MIKKNCIESDCGRVYASLGRQEKSKCIVFLCQNVGDSYSSWSKRLPKWAKGEIPNKMKPLELERIREVFEKREESEKNS